jgi:phosphohistidine phosphatase SixA
MPLVVIRHGRAGDSSEWADDDRKRPLDERGVRQAAALVDKLVDVPLTRILSSPYDRCVQTVEPLAVQRGLEVELRDELGENRQQLEGVALVHALVGDPVVVCVHGGLPEATFGERLKKGEMLFVDGDGRVVGRRSV